MSRTTRWIAAIVLIAVVVVVGAAFFAMPGSPGRALLSGPSPEPDPVTAEDVEMQRMVGQYVVANSRCGAITQKWPQTGAAMGTLAMPNGVLTATDECGVASPVAFVRTEITGAFVFRAWGRETSWDAAAHAWTTDTAATPATVWRLP